jgi:predicted RNA polymerase sigma factor
VSISAYPAHGAEQGLALLSALDGSYEASTLAPYQPLAVARAYLLQKHGDRAAAQQSYTHALTLTPHAAQRQYLQKQIDILQI